MDHITPDNTLTDECYMALKDEDIIVLCRRCAMARRKGYVLCEECNKKYHRPKYIMCSKCSEWCKENMVAVEVPCNNFIYVEKDMQFRIVDICMHHCGSPEIKGNINSCKIFLDWSARNQDQ